MKEKLLSLQSRISETDNTIKGMKNDYQKELEQKNQLIKENQEKVCYNYCAIYSHEQKLHLPFI